MSSMVKLLYSLTIGLLTVGCTFGQVDKYLNDSTIKCYSCIIVRPDLLNEISMSDCDTEELNNASSVIASSFIEDENSVIIEKSQFKNYSKCNSKVVVVKLKNYYKTTAKLGQFQGNITIEALTFGSASDMEPKSTQAFTAIGGRDWGSSKLLMNSIEKVVKKIKVEYLGFDRKPNNQDVENGTSQDWDR